MSVDKHLFTPEQTDTYDFYARKPVSWHSDEETDRLVATHCCYCGVQCAIGHLPDVPAPTTGRESAEWVEADAAGIPEREAPPQPWTPRTPPDVPPAPAPSQDPGRGRRSGTPEEVPAQR